MKPSTILAVVIVGGAARGARADGIAWSAGGTGIYVHASEPDNNEPRRSRSVDAPGAALAATLGYHVMPSLAIGLRLGTSFHRYKFDDEGSHTIDHLTISLVPIEAGITAAFTHDLVWVAPWVGLRRTVLHESDTFCGSPCLPAELTTEVRSTTWSAGATVGMDLWGHTLRAGPELEVAASAHVFSVGVGFAIRR